MPPWPRPRNLSARARFLFDNTPALDPILVSEVNFTCNGLHVLGISMGTKRPEEYGQQHVFVSTLYIRDSLAGVLLI